jgi:hypothetical protein
VPFPPTKAIIIGVDVLLSVSTFRTCFIQVILISTLLCQAANGVSASYDALFDLFDCVGNFLARLHIYTEHIPLAPTMSDILVKIMAEVLGVLAVATKQIKQGRFSKWFVVNKNQYALHGTAKFAKKLLGESEIEATLQRLDRLTHEEARVTAAHTLEVVHGLVNNLKVVMDGTQLRFIGPKEITLTCPSRRRSIIRGYTAGIRYVQFAHSY